jgi:ATP-dependent DNA helicase RecG
MGNETRKMTSPSIDDPLQFIKGVGPKKAEALQRKNLYIAKDCLFYIPFRYEDRSNTGTISSLVAGEHMSFNAEITAAGSIFMGRRKRAFEIILQDKTGVVRAKYYQFNPSYMKDKFKVGARVVVSGKAQPNRRAGSRLELVHPIIEIDGASQESNVEMGRIIPVYQTTEGLHIKSLRSIIHSVIETYSVLLEDFLPSEIAKRHGYPPLAQAIREAHFPEEIRTMEELNRFKTPAQERLIFDELFLIQLALIYKRNQTKDAPKGFTLKTRGPLIKKFFQGLAFELTNAQKKVLKDIMKDLENPAPMNRLIQGDVGSGKTVVALIAILTAVDNGYQGALMAPTEILAEQHFQNLSDDCAKLGINLELVTGSLPAKEKALALERVREGISHIVVGTHALIQKDVQFDRLGVAVIDEQHRFGVLQREALNKKGLSPHILVMTATPIPRSLALTIYGDLDVSLIDELPPGRKPITTKVYLENKRDDVYGFVSQEIAKGRQAYIVCPLIEETEKMDLQNATEVYEYLQNKYPQIKIGLVHGKIKPAERRDIMSEFKAAKIQALVATTVIEVGVHVSNATLMIIEHAERFGLSQLHQLRGRIGRGEHASHCLLVAYYPMSESGKARLEAMKESQDGFYIAEKDLEIRGPGDFLGTRQSGLPELKVANIVRDIKVLEVARKEAQDLLQTHPDLNSPELVKLKEELLIAMGDRMNLMNII